MTARTRIYDLLADAVLITHFAFVLFVVAGLVVIWIGKWRGWNFVRNFWFRAAHLLAMGIVVAESLIGMICPLTEWEAALRSRAGETDTYSGSFIQHWVHRVMFFDVSERAFTVIYVVFFAVMLLTFWVVPPRPPRRFRQPQNRG